MDLHAHEQILLTQFSLARIQCTARLSLQMKSYSYQDWRVKRCTRLVKITLHVRVISQYTLGYKLCPLARKPCRPSQVLKLCAMHGACTCSFSHLLCMLITLCVQWLHNVKCCYDILNFGQYQLKKKQWLCWLLQKNLSWFCWKRNFHVSILKTESILWFSLLV